MECLLNNYQHDLRKHRRMELTEAICGLSTYLYSIGNVDHFVLIPGFTRLKVKKTVQHRAALLIALFITLLCTAPFNSSIAQDVANTDNSASISVSGRVIQSLSAQNIIIDVLANVNLVATEPNQAFIEIDPTVVPVTFDDDLLGTGFAVAIGEPGTKFFINFPREVVLTNNVDGNILIIEYDIAHNQVNEQQNANRIRQISEEFILNDNGEYYFWFGGKVDIRNVTDGEYMGDFFMEVEYTL